MGVGFKMSLEACPECGRKLTLVESEGTKLLQCVCGFRDLVVSQGKGLPATHGYLADWVKKDPDTVEHILTVALSSATGKPLNLMLRGRSSVGKSWPIARILGLFPNASILSGATPKNFFYENGAKVDDKGDSIEPRLKFLNEEIAGTQGTERAAAENEKRELLAGARILLDFRGKIFGVLDSVPQELWDTLKAALSHDTYEMEYRTVVEGRQRIVLIRGWPCIIYATAANEERRRGWEQIRNRYVVITPADTPEKFEAANHLTSDLYGLPSVALQALYPRKKLDDATAEIAEALATIARLKAETQNGDDDPTANVIFNPFRRWLDGLFPHVVGDDMRNYRYLHAYINVSALMNAGDRLRLRVDGRVVAIMAGWRDIERAIDLVGKDLTPLTADKIAFYQKWIVPMWGERPGSPKPPFTVADVVEYARERGRPLSRTSVRDTYLDLFVDVGLLKEDNPERKTNEAIEYRPILDDEELRRFIEGFRIPRQPEPETVNGAISELGGILAGRQVAWETDGGRTVEGEGVAFWALGRHGQIEPRLANGGPNHLGNPESSTIQGTSEGEL